MNNVLQLLDKTLEENKALRAKVDELRKELKEYEVSSCKEYPVVSIGIEEPKKITFEGKGALQRELIDVFNKFDISKPLPLNKVLIIMGDRYRTKKATMQALNGLVGREVIKINNGEITIL